MNIVKVILQHRDGTLYYTTNIKDIINITTSIPRNVTWAKTTNIGTLSNKYFAMLTELAKNANTGYSKTDLHNAMKPLIFSKFGDFKHYFKNNTPTQSTTDLNYEGWVATIEQLRVVANDVFGYVFKDI